MSQRRPRFARSLSVLLVLLLAGACGGPTELATSPMPAPPSIDGKLDDWGGRLTYVNDGAVSMGVAPTDSLLYVALSVQDRATIRSIVANGLILWVDPSGTKKRRYGVQYPLGLRNQRRGGLPAPPPEQTGGPRTTPLTERVDLSELDVVRHDSTRRRIPARFSSGLRAEATLGPGAMIYEVAIPVGTPTAQSSGDREHGLRTALSGPVDLGLETPDPDDEDTALPAQDEGVPSVTGRRGRRGRAQQGGRRRPRRRTSPEDRQSRMRSIDLWTRVVVTPQP
jgi:hypothetical protein